MRALSRREALVRAVLLVGGAGALARLSACAPAPRSQGQGRYFEPARFATLGEVVETMIPETDTPGAKALNVHGFIDLMMADWAVSATRAEFADALALIDSEAERRGGAFLSLAPTERAGALAAVDAVSFAPTPDAHARAYRRLKRLAFYGYFTSEGADPDYVRIPGGYEGDISRERLAQLVAERR